MIIGLYLMSNNSPFRLRMLWSDKENNVVVCYETKLPPDSVINENMCCIISPGLDIVQQLN